MELYPLLFSSCRIPGPKHDYVSHHRRSPTHITVVRNYQVRGRGPGPRSRPTVLVRGGLWRHPPPSWVHEKPDEASPLCDPFG